jgi:outer membrane protein insertion porin family
MNEPDAYQKYQNIEGVWGKNNVYLIFSNETWECLFALDNIAPLFNGDEDYAYPDGFDSYDDYINDVNNQLLVASCEGNRGYFEILHNYVTLYDDNASYKLKYEINNGELKLMATNNNLLRIFYDKALYRPFNPELRSNANEDIFYNLNGIWIKR